MSKNRIFGLLLLTALTIVTLLPVISKGESMRQIDETELKITYFNVIVQLADLDLVARRVHFTLSGTLGFDFNASSEIYYVTVETMGTYTGTTRIGKVISGPNSSHFTIYSNESSFDGYFSGGPETYPFDRYKFNFTLSFFLQDVSLAAENVTFSQAIDWPLRAQFENPSAIFTSVTQTASGPAVSVGFSLNRSEWRGYATLLPIYFIFALLGFSTFIKIERNKLTHRMAVYTAVFTSALAYSISLQNTLPPGRYYISIPEVLIYSIIAGTTIFIIATLLAYRFKINLVLVDIISAIITQAFLSFLVLTFYFARYVEIDFDYLPSRMLNMQWIILAIFSFTVYVSAISDFHALSQKRIGSEHLAKRLDNIIKRLYLISFVLDICTSGIIAFENSVRAGIQPGFVRALLLTAAGNNVWLMILLQTVFSTMYLSFTYSISTIFRHFFGNDRLNWVRDFFGFLFVFSFMINFLYAFLLLPADPNIYVTSPIAASVCTYLFWVIRPTPPEKSYNQFIKWLNV
jgi:hypothetical protein